MMSDPHDVFDFGKEAPISTQTLSPRESEIVELAIEGLTNEGIANQLGLSVGTVNTYWLRIRLKVGGVGRTDSVAKVITERAEKAIILADRGRQDLVDYIANREHALLEARASLALLELAMGQIKSTVWATDLDLVVHMLANADLPARLSGVPWETGKTVYDIFKSNDPAYLPVAAHLDAVNGNETTLRLDGEFSKMTLRVLPLQDETSEIVGCISILNATEVFKAV